MTWLCMKMADGRIGAARESDVVSLAMHPDHEHAKVRFEDGSIDDVVSIQVVGSLGDVLPAMVKLCHPEPPPGAPSTLSPCGECILQAGEVCDVCGATNAALPCGDPWPPPAGLVLMEIRPGGWCVGYRNEFGDATYFDDDPAKASPEFNFKHWPQSVWGVFPSEDAARKAVEDAGLSLAGDPAPEPETSYARVLRTKVCPHCSADIGSNIWDCPACGKSLEQRPDKRKAGDEWTTEGGRLLRYVPWTDQLGPTLAVLDVDAGKIIATGDASCMPFDWSGPGKPTIGGNLAVNAGFPDGSLSIKRVQSYFRDAGRWEIVRRYRSGWTKDQELLPEEMRIEDFGATFETLDDAMAAVRSHKLEASLVSWSDWLDAQADHHGIPRDDPRLERDCAP